MKRIDLILNSIERLDKGQGVTTIEISKTLNLERSNVSKDLNKLVSLGKLYKNSSRPVKYFLNSPNVINFSARSSIDNLAYLYPSLAPAIKLAKTSIIYPPNGMNSLIIGDTGVGKSMLAKLMYEYAQSLSPSETMPFVHFNCSDYSNNPQLLSAHLFGVKKGTFTGANEDRPGLIEQADGGFLFLDEIHNLPSEGQEMLFVYMDTGYFKRFGEVSKQLKSTTRIICATNKDINSSLLDTFIRRIPIKISLPGLNERLLEERLTLIEYFLKEESLKLDKPILVSYNAMLCLLSYHCQYNIGQLKNDITLVVANAFSDYFINNKKQLKINSPDLPELIKSMSNSPLIEEKELLNSLNFEHGYITYDASTEITSHSYVKQRHVILGCFTNLIKNIDNIVINKDTPRETINNLFEIYLNIINDNKSNYRFSLNDSAFKQFVDEASLSNESIKRAFETSRIEEFFKIHIDLIYDRINLLNFNPLPVLNRLKSCFNKEYNLAFDITSVMEKTYNINISSVEVLFLVLFCIYINQ
ncbi:sigma 54-interacting transcriptional regulator [Clostridium sp. NSJ-145]|uniref:sigma 54-interacting transcriptional regulator n=1 Tax=Clostridium sp. NSJ-145 TaxID=2897777 RepID=UPI001E43D980|nr:sigma 54-interacting transcriptional regulator [Clostridium sp. NSJ-145]MCD2501434.1 sigma 54-interacting transcriptional regulator [Clostridium sp. NSJ-145]